MADGGRTGSARASNRSSLRRYLPVAGIAAAVIAIVGIIAFLIVRSMGDAGQTTKKMIQQVQIIRPPPPPETPPPPPPEPEKVDVQEPDEPEPDLADADQPPPGDQLGLDAEGVAGGDGFGLLGRKGGRDLLGSGSDGYGWYGQILKADLIDRLAEFRDIRRDRYSIEVRIWLSPDGDVQRFKVVNSTGNPQLDRDLLTALGTLDRVSERPPEGLPQPVRLPRSGRPVARAGAGRPAALPTPDQARPALRRDLDRASCLPSE